MHSASPDQSSQVLDLMVMVKFKVSSQQHPQEEEQELLKSICHLQQASHYLQLAFTHQQAMLKLTPWHPLVAASVTAKVTHNLDRYIHRR